MVTMQSSSCEWVVIDGECYVACMNSISGDVDKNTANSFSYCPYCGKDFELKKDKASIKKAMHAMKIEHDKEVMEDDIEAEMKERQDAQVALFEQFIHSALSRLDK